MIAYKSIACCVVSSEISDSILSLSAFDKSRSAYLAASNSRYTWCYAKSPSVSAATKSSFPVMPLDSASDLKSFREEVLYREIIYAKPLFKARFDLL